MLKLFVNGGFYEGRRYATGLFKPV